MSAAMKVGIYLHDGFTFEPRGQCPFYWRDDELRRRCRFNT